MYIKVFCPKPPTVLYQNTKCFTLKYQLFCTKMPSVSPQIANCTN